MYGNPHVATWIKNKADTRSYAECHAFLAGERERKVASNVTVVRRTRNRIAIRLYQTDIITYHADGTFTFDNGGFATPTTSSRCNQFGPKGWWFSHSKRKLYAWNPGKGSFVQGTRCPA